MHTHVESILEHVELVRLGDVGGVLEDGEEDGVADGRLGAQGDHETLQGHHDLDAQHALAL